MPKRTDISKILILGFGCIAAAGTGWMVTASLAIAECVTVTPNDEPSSVNVRIETSREGKPLQNVKINLDTARPFFTTDAQGIVFLPKLRPGKHCIIATALDSAVAQLCIDVSSKSNHKRSSFSIELPPSPTMQELARAENMPVRDRVQEFRGTVQDRSPSGAAVPGTKIQILLKGSNDETHAIQIEADASGHFLAHLPEGVYMAFFRSPGFDTQIEVFEIGKGLDSKDLRITLKIGWC
jgi:hypothetical protein